MITIKPTSITYISKCYRIWSSYDCLRGFLSFKTLDLIILHFYPLQIIHIFYLAHHRYWCNHVTFRLLTIPRGEIDMVPDVTQLRLLALFYSCIRKSANACIWFLQLFKMHILHAIIFSYSTLNAFDLIEHVTHM